MSRADLKQKLLKFFVFFAIFAFVSVNVCIFLFQFHTTSYEKFHKGNSGDFFINLVSDYYFSVYEKDALKFEKEILNNLPNNTWIIDISDNKPKILAQKYSNKRSLFTGFSLKNEEIQSLKNAKVITKKSFLFFNRIKITRFEYIKDGIVVAYNEIIPFDIGDIRADEFKRWVLDNLALLLLINFVFSGILFAFFYLTYEIISRFFTQTQDRIKTLNKYLIQHTKKLSKDLRTDALTGLANKYSLDEDLKNMQYPKLIIFKIDDFPKMNDYYGEQICDLVILEISKIAKEFARKENLKVYRISAGKYAFSEDFDCDVDRYEELVAKLLDLFKGRVVECKAEDESSVFVEIYCTMGFSLDRVGTYKKALMALEKARENGKDFMCYFKKIDDSDKYVALVKTTGLIRNAIIQDAIIPYFQPIFDRDKKIVKYEVLVRIIDSKGDIILPGVFLNNSKRIKRYAEIEKMLVEKTLIIAKNNPNALISINISARDMTDGDVSVFIINKLNELQVAHQIIFEVVEDESIDDVERVLVFINKVRRLGAQIAIDDFGSGYSNFSYFIQLKPDYFKIDGSIVKNIDTNENSLIVLKTIVSLAKSLGIRTVAEFVHSEVIFEKCIELGVDEFQGYFLSEPLGYIKEQI